MVYIQTKNSQFGKILDLPMGGVGIFYDHLLYFMAVWCTYFVAIWYILWSFGTSFPFW
jgi:hypothetical protein